MRAGRLEMIDVAGQLIVQEGPGVVAGALDQAQVRQRHDDGRVARRGEFALGVAEVADLAVVDAGALGAEILLPVGIHRGFLA